MSNRKNTAVITWLFAGCFLIFAMVIIGGITRLTHSGLSMVEWKFTGSLPPLNEHDWNEQFDKYKTSPEYQQINSHFTVEEFKSIFWWEFIHRMLGRTIGIVFIIPFLWFLYKKKFPEGFLRKVSVLLFLGFLQGLLGWIMVKSGLNKNPHVSHYLLAAHLSMAFLTFGCTFWFALDLFFPSDENVKSPRIRKTTILLLVLVSIQIIYGAFVAGLQAGLLYPTWPKMGTTWIPPEAFSGEPFWKNLLENHSGVQFIHRTLAIIVTLLVGWIFYLKRQSSFSLRQIKLINLLAAAVCLQFVLGVTTLLMHVPVSVASLHQVGAFFLVSIILTLLHRLR